MPQLGAMDHNAQKNLEALPYRMSCLLPSIIRRLCLYESKFSQRAIYSEELARVAPGRNAYLLVPSYLLLFAEDHLCMCDIIDQPQSK